MVIEACNQSFSAPSAVAQLDHDLGIEGQEDVHPGTKLDETDEVVDIDSLALLDVGDDAARYGPGNLADKDFLACAGADDDR